MIGVNPFNEPDVSASKKITRDLLDAQELTTEPRIVPVAELAATLQRAGSRSYLAVLNYLPSDPTVNDMLDEFAQSVRDRFGLPVSINAGPRYLHSTGQLHKGGSDPVMDIGATVCIRRKPKCLACPIRSHCKARALGSADRLPTPRKSRVRPRRMITMVILFDPTGRVLKTITISNRFRDPQWDRYQVNQQCRPDAQ